MHETVIAERIIEDAKQYGRINSITVEVGELSSITPEELEPTLKSLVKWKIKISTRKSKVRCDCGYTGAAKIIERSHGLCLFVCPKCNGVPEIIEGGDIKIIKATVD